MFPTLGLFASVRCPELSASNPGGPCKRNPCLFSHTAPPPRTLATAAITSTVGSKASSSSTSNSSTSAVKRSSDAIIKNGKSNDAADDADGRPRKVQKHASSTSSASRTSALFTKDEDEVEVMASKTSSKTAPIAMGTSRLGAPRAMGGARTSSMIITGSGKVIRKGAAPALQARPSPTSTTSTTFQTSSLKGKERASTSSQTNGTRPAPVAAFMSDAGPPRLPLNTPASYVPVITRNAMVKAMYQEFIRVYENFSPKQRHNLASEHALSQELTIYGKNNKFSYKTACIATIARLKKRPSSESMDETGTMEEYDKHIKDAAEAEKDVLTVSMATALTMDREAMLAHDYIVEVPEGPGGNIPTEEGGSMKCERCAADYIVHGNMTEAEQTACIYHWGRPEIKTDRSRRWNCCQMPIDAPGCTRGPHVFIEKTAEELHTRAAFVRTEDLRHPEGSRPLKMAALDCELIRTTAGMALARLTIVDEDGTNIFDEFIRPNGMVVDLVTRWSGVTEQDLEEKARINFEKLRRDILGKYVDENTSTSSSSTTLNLKGLMFVPSVLIGHGLENDLKALRLVHPPGKVIDTTHLYPHTKGLPYRRALRFLAQEHLGIFIQDGGAAGHSSLVDARAALDLVKLKARKMVESGIAV